MPVPDVRARIPEHALPDPGAGPGPASDGGGDPALGRQLETRKLETRRDRAADEVGVFGDRGQSLADVFEPRSIGRAQQADRSL